MNHRLHAACLRSLPFVLLSACASTPDEPTGVERHPLFREARQDIAQRFPASAAKKLQQLVPEYGDDPVLLRWLGRARILAGDGAGGREALRRTLEKSPEDLQARTWLADSAREDEQFEDAVEAYRAIHTADPANGPALRALIELELRMGREREALTLLATAIRQQPEDPDLRELALRAALELREFERAVLEGEALLRTRSTPETRELVAQALTKLDPREATPDERKRAEVHLREAMRLAPQSERYPYQLAVLLHADGTPQSERDAVELYRRALEIHPGFQPAMENLADLYDTSPTLRDSAKAIELLERVLPLETNDEKRAAIRERLSKLIAARDGDSADK
ncbi:MAG: tetratricopeptide repeat protein [Planctomycetes bacterium]|nr:tetratricopeptide repeat protein [Planctomycetota bacterium]